MDAKNTGKPRDFPVFWGRDTSESEGRMTILRSEERRVGKEC